MFRSRWSLPVVIGLVATSIAGIAATPASGFSSVTQSSIVNDVPATNTPDVNNGAVLTITQVGGTMYIGGSFTSISTHGSSAAVPANFIAAFDPGTGALNTTFAPTLNGAVQSLEPGPAANEIYVGGSFSTADGVSTHVALLNATTGAMIGGWHAAPLNGVVQKLSYVPNVDHTGTAMLFAGGSFTTAGGAAHGGLVSLDPLTGAVLPYAGLAFTGHHNFGVNCTNCANGAVGIRDMDVDPSGTHLVAVGNFNTVSGNARDQLALIDLGTSSASVDPNFQTLAYSAACFSGAFDTYMRGVSFSTDGGYFVVVDTGGSGTNKDGTNSSCDTAARFETTASGSNVRPTWIDYTGQDTLLSVAITGGVVYVGGHERWLNNSHGHDNPGEGAVPRPGLAALNPISGMPYTWNPGRNPRGAGTSALYPTTTGLWIGSDTDYIGPTKYLHKKLAFFPLTGGEPVPTETAPSLPGKVFTAGGFLPSNTDRFTYRTFDGSQAGTETSMSTGIAWSGIRGAFVINGELIYAKPDGNLYERTFDGTNLGSETLIDPYDDPVWDNVATGSGQTYRGTRSDLSSVASSITSMFFTRGRLYYTVSGQSAMQWRWFEPESGIVGSDTFTVNDGKNWSNIAGAFVSGQTLYYADKNTGALSSVGWNGTQATGNATVVNATQNWASRGLFLLSGPQVPNQPPHAAFTAKCSTASTSCTFDASASSDPDGSISDFAWTFGQSATEHHADSTQFSHDFGQSGHFDVTLTVADNDGATDTTDQIVDVGQSTATPTFRNATTACGPTGGTGNCATTVSETDVAVPTSTAAGDGLLLFVTWPSSTTASAAVPASWQLVGTNTSSPLESNVYFRPAVAGDVGSTVPVTFSANTRNSVILADYTGMDTSGVEAFAKSTDSNTSSHTTPTATVTQDGSLALSYWSDKGSNTAWTLPASVTGHSTQIGSGAAGYPSSALADSGTPVASGSYGSKTATTSVASGKGTEWTIILAPASADPPANSPPHAAFTSTCTNLACIFDATNSTDDGTISSYAWDFNDGNSGSGVTPSHTYSAGGTYQVKLTVTDNDGATDSTTNPVTVSAAAPQNIGFVGSDARDGSAGSEAVTIPAATQAGDTLLLFESHASTTVTATPPTGWTQVATTSSSNLRSAVYQRAATGSDAGATITVAFSAAVKGEAVVAAYRNVAASPIESVQSSTATSTSSHSTPALTGLTNGTWVTTFWTDKSTTTSAWTPPASVTKRADVYGTGGGAVSALLADTNAGVSGSYPAQTATTNVSSGSAAQYAIALRPLS